MTRPEPSAPFRLGHVVGVTPDKWARRWRERRPRATLDLVVASTEEIVTRIRAGGLDAGLVRLPIDRTGLHAIPLYTETTVVVLPADHALTLADEVGADDLTDEIVLRPGDDTLAWADTRAGRAAAVEPDTTADAVAFVAAGAGLLIVPLSIARLHHRRDLAHRPVVGVPTSGVVLTWPDADNSDDMEEFIGVVRGRSPHSSRTPRRTDPTPPPAARRPPPPPGRRTPRRRTRRR